MLPCAWFRARSFPNSGVMGRPQPAVKCSHSCLLTTSPSGMGERIGRTKARKCLGQGKDSLKVKERGKGKVLRRCVLHLSWSDWCPASLWAVATLEDVPPPDPKFVITEHDVIKYGTALWLVWVSSPSCVPSQILAHYPSTCWGRQSDKQESFDAVQALFSNSRKHWCVTNTVLVTNSTRSRTWPAMRKVNSIPARPGTPHLDSIFQSEAVFTCQMNWVLQVWWLMRILTFLAIWSKVK